MGLQDTVSWYQKKIGTYDKQQWEKTIEQRILHGLTHVPMKTAKLKTELIDVDLVRGSSFPKAKPKHGFKTVMRLAMLRLLFLPVFSRWWIQQTSPRIFTVLLILYILQLFNTVVYIISTNGLPDNSSEHVPSSEIFAPITLMLALSIIHTQIVSTNPEPDRPAYSRQKNTKQRRRRLRQKISSTEKVLIETNSEKLTTSRSSSYVKRVQIITSEHELNIAAEKGKKNVPDKNENIPNGENKEQEIIQRRNGAPVMDDDGFESLNGNASSGEDEPIRNEKRDEKTENKKSKDKLPGLKIKQNSENCLPLSREVLSDFTDNQPPNQFSFPLCKAWVENVLKSQCADSTLTRRRCSAPDYRCSSPENESLESDTDTHLTIKNTVQRRRSILKIPSSQPLMESSCCDSEDEDCDTVSTPGTGGSCCPLNNDVTLATEWMGITTNSEDCSCGSEYDESDSKLEFNNNDQSFAWDFDLTPTVILTSSSTPSDRVTCTIWERREIKKADLTVLDISSTIIERVEAMPETLDYFYGGVVLSALLALIPAACRYGEATKDAPTSDIHLSVSNISNIRMEQFSDSLSTILDLAFGSTAWERSVMTISLFQRFVLGCIFFFLLAVSERTFKQRFLYAKLFSHLTSSRRARKSNLPHFRLNKVRNIKTWLSVRSYLKKRGPQRSVDVIVSAAFVITLLLLSFISKELLKDSMVLHSQYNLEAMFWSFAIGIYLLRFMTLGTNINRKYRNLSTLITEQINLYLQIEMKPHKKDELTVANSVLKLAADLLKELESPFTISTGLSANPYLYTITKVIILSAFSGVLSEVLGFKLQLHKIRIK